MRLIDLDPNAIFHLFRHKSFNKEMGLEDNADPFESQETHYHQFSIAEHTVRGCYHLNEMFKSNEFLQTVMTMAYFFHDLGKLYPGVKQPHKSDPKRMTYYGHEYKSAKIAREFLTRHKKLSQSEIDLVCCIVLNHMRPYGLVNKEKSINKFKVACAENNGGYDNVHELVIYHCMADVLAKDSSTTAESQDYIDIQTKLEWVKHHE